MTNDQSESTTTSTSLRVEQAKERTLADYRPQHDAGCAQNRCAVCGERHRNKRISFGRHDFHDFAGYFCTCGLDALLAVRAEARPPEERDQIHTGDDELLDAIINASGYLEAIACEINDEDPDHDQIRDSAEGATTELAKAHELRMKSLQAPPSLPADAMTRIETLITGYLQRWKTAKADHQQQFDANVRAIGDDRGRGAMVSLCNQAIDDLQLIVAALGDARPATTDEKRAIDDGNGMTGVYTFDEALAEIQRLGRRCDELIAQTQAPRIDVKHLKVLKDLRAALDSQAFAHFNRTQQLAALDAALAALGDARPAPPERSGWLPIASHSAGLIHQAIPDVAETLPRPNEVTVVMNARSAGNAVISQTRKIAELRGLLAACYRLTGADPDGNEDWRLAEQAVSEVARLRAGYEKAEAERDAARQALQTRTAGPTDPQRP